jgi:multidrug efflux pump subunit AcrA (membrane-fusion protein)
LVSIDSALTYADTILWLTNENKNLNDTYEIYLSAKNTSYKTNAEYDFVKAKSLYDNVYNSKSTDIDKLIELYELVNVVVSLYENLVKVWENSIVSSSLPDTSTTWISLTWIKTNVKTYQGTILWVKSASLTLQNSWNDLSSTISSTKTSLETNRSSLNQALMIAQTSLENTKNSINTNIDSLNWNETLTKNQLESTLASIKQSRDAVDNALKIAENNYNSTKAKLDSSLAWVKTQLDTATGQKNSLQEQYENSLIKAPFDGVITSKNIEVWTMVSSQSQAFVISNWLNKIIKIDVSSDNIKYLSLWKEVNISKNWRTWTWIISVLAVAADPQTKMFKVEITFNNKDLNDYLVLWDFVDIFIQKDVWTEKFIIIPFSALIVWSNDSYTVYVVSKDNLVEQIKIEVWASNSNEVVVTKWLKQWDRVIIEWALNISVWDLVEEIK